jgi:protein subunit release factor B
MSRELLFRVTAADCDWTYQRGSGKGGQAVNKTNNAVRCTHRASGAAGYSHDTRSQDQNKRIAFRRMAESDEFKRWHRMETARRMGVLADVERRVDESMRRVRVERRVDGRWQEWVDDERLLSGQVSDADGDVHGRQARREDDTGDGADSVDDSQGIGR